MKLAQIVASYGIVAAVMAGGLFADTTPSPYQIPSDSEVIGYLLQSVNWYRHVYAERQVANEPTDFMFLNNNQAIERNIVKLSFEFAKSDAMLKTSSAFLRGRTTPTDPAPADLAHFIELKNRNDELSQQATKEIQNLDEKLKSVKGPERSKLQAAQEEAQTRLRLLGAVAQGLNDLVEFVESPTEVQAQSRHLDSTIDDLGESIPEMKSDAVPSTTALVQETNAKIVSSNAGILTLISDVSATNRKLDMVDEKIRLTDNLRLSANSLRIPLADFITRVIQSVDISNFQTSDLLSLREQKSHLDTITANLTELSPVIVALDKQKVLLEEYRSHLLSWRIAVAGQYRHAWAELLTRAMVVLSIIALLLAISQLSRRFTVRRVHDPNRRRFISMSHNLVTVAAIMVVIVFMLASDLGAIATYFGLLSAGLLLALENVILASLGALLLVGKRGIRIGDRVQVSGITGDVTDMGLLQFQLREVEVATGRFTGHVATFSNSLVFVSPTIALVRFDSAQEGDSEAEITAKAEPEAEAGASMAGG